MIQGIGWLLIFAFFGALDKGLWLSTPGFGVLCSRSLHSVCNSVLGIGTLSISIHHRFI